MKQKEIKIDDYGYILPPERIARYPLPERDSCKLLVWKEGTPHDICFRDIVTTLSKGTLLVRNNTKVIPARLHMYKPTGGVIELFLLSPTTPNDYLLSLEAHQPVRWKTLVGNAKRWQPGQSLSLKLSLEGKSVTLWAERVEEEIAFSWEHATLFSFGEILDAAGEIPIPPYLERKSEPSDRLDYATVYAQWDGSVAAPTAGLHFTESLFDALVQRGIDHADVTLHVGAGTFLPVKSGTMAGHSMHSELCVVDRATLERILSHNAEIFAIGTTSVRTLESLYWLALDESANVSQWQPYLRRPHTSFISRRQALERLLNRLDEANSQQLVFSTELLIAPGYRFRMVDGMVTNFHQPKSTLLLLVAAMIGNDWRKLYDHALSSDYRFLSYGDACLLYV